MARCPPKKRPIRSMIAFRPFLLRPETGSMSLGKKVALKPLRRLLGKCVYKPIKTDKMFFFKRLFKLFNILSIRQLKRLFKTAVLKSALHYI
jgi:hypothetical protein